MRIAEIYKSIQGEGRLSGAPSVFVRASGCNLRCWFCDTPYASWNPEGQDLSVGEILDRCDEWDCSHFVLTGGEPMLFAELIPLCAALRSRERHVTIETAGTLDLPVECDLMSISPKLAGSAPSAAEHPRWRRRHEQTRRAPHVVRMLVERYDYQLKFVVDAPIDCDRIERYLDAFPEIDRSRAMLMPQGRTLEELTQRSGWLEEQCRRRGLTYCPRRQFEWFGELRGV